MCVCVSLSLSEFQKCPSHFILSYNFTQRERKKRNVSTKALFFCLNKSRRRRSYKKSKKSFSFSSSSQVRCCLRRRKKSSKAIILLVVLKVLFFWRLLIRCSKVFLVLCLFFLLFFVSLSLDWVVLFSYYFCLNPKPRRVFLEKKTTTTLTTNEKICDETK